MQEVFEKIIAEFDNRIGMQLKIMAGLGNGALKYGFGKSLDAYQQGKMIVEAASEEYNNGWILCSERLPEKHVDVLVAFVDHDAVIAWYSEANKQWKNSSTDNVIKANVIAWQPLPELYKEQDS